VALADLFLFLLASYGLTNAINAGKIFLPVRNFLSLLSDSLHNWIICPMCIGFPVGILISLFQFDGISWSKAIILGFGASGACWIIRVILAKLGEDLL
jgi:hypothetical protein